MAMNKQINELLNRKMDRRDFLKHLGVGTLALFGLGSAMKAITSFSPGQQSQAQNAPSNANQSFAYGGGPYGGRRSS